MERFKGVIFDFNGTMIFDTDIHRSVWLEFMPALTGKPITADEIDRNMIGVDNATIFRRYLGENLSDERIEQLAYDKEAAYREKCRKDPVRARLVDGLPEFLDALKQKNIPCTIATGSEINNLKFYFEIFDLARWFDFDKVVYDDGSFPGKPSPDIYLLAAAKLGLNPSECVVFEDSYSGVRAAHAAGVGCVLSVNENTPDSAYVPYGGVAAVAHDFVGYLSLLTL